MQILVIEDDPDVRDTVCSALESLYPEARLTTLSDGSRFLEVLDKINDWGLIILDIMLPEISGIDICRRIRADGVGAGIPILAMTGYDTPDMQQKVKEAGATGYLTKPFEIADFTRAVRRVMGA